VTPGKLYVERTRSRVDRDEYFEIPLLFFFLREIRRRRVVRRRTTETIRGGNVGFVA